MLKRITCLLAILTVAVLARAQGMKGYEYWIDADYGSHQSVSSTQTDISLQLSTAEMGKGVHYFNVRAQGADDEWGPISRYLFYVPEAMGEAAHVAAMQYWIDNDHASRQIVDVSSTDITHAIDVSTLAQGVHFLNIRLQDADGVWSAPSRHIFYMPEPMSSTATVTKMEYLIDDDAATLTTVNVSSPDIAHTIDVSTLSEGVHYLTLRLQNSEGVWGMPTRHVFFNPGNDYAVESPLVGYRYSFNDESQYVTIPEQKEYHLDGLVLPLPDPLVTGSLTEGCTYTFSDHEAHLKRTVQMNFSIAFENKIHVWSNTTSEQFAVTDEVSHPLTPLSLDHPATVQKVSAGDFAALTVKSSQNRTYYLHATQPCQMILFRPDGILLTMLDMRDATRSYPIQLGLGDYHAIVFQTTRDDEHPASNLTIRLQENEHFVPEPVISYKDEVITMSCPMAEATILYSLDGTEPQTLYATPFLLQRNAELRARAVRQGYDSSELVALTIDSYKVATPVVTFTNLKVYINCATPETTIRYTLDGSDPLTNGLVYTEPVAISANCKVRAVATRSHWHDSEVTSLDIDVTHLTTATPVIERQGNVLVVTSLTEGARFHYTLDGSTPTTDSPSTDRIIKPEHNCTVKVIATKVGELPSPVVTTVVDWMQAEKPSFVYSNGLLTILCNTPGATIYYEIGDKEPTRASAVYTAPLTLVDNRTVRALAVAPNFNDSEIGDYRPDAFTCEKPVLAYNGRYLTMTTATEGATIRYTLDGTIPGSNAAEYTRALEISELLTVCAITVKANTNSSDTTMLKVQSYYDGRRAETAQEGVLSQAFAWVNPADIDRLTLLGRVSDADMQWLISHLTSLQHLDMSGARMQGDRLTTATFSGLSVVSLQVPATITSAAPATFGNCKQLATIVWNPSVRLTDAMLEGLNNPNLLVFAKTRGYAPASVTNVVVDGHADRIMLSDEGDNCNFFCVEQFQADHVSYVHHYAQQTGLGECRGWETLALPFDVQRVSHSLNGTAAPFAAQRTDGERRFWLCQLSSSGFESADAIKANTPYVVAMPNHPSYADEYVLAGQVTYEATNAIIHSSHELRASRRGSITLTPTFTALPKGDAMLVLNVGQPFEGYQEGSAFFADLDSAVRPFQAYAVDQASSVRVFSIAQEATGISELQPAQTDTPVWHDLQGRCMGSHPDRLRKGIYIVGGRKILKK
jgi:hypothetical protein